jgi:hypothetical protein
MSGFSFRTSFRLLPAAATEVLLAAVASPAIAQKVVGAGTPTQLKDISMLKPPPGAKVGIVEWEDLECPACARAFPIVHDAANHYHIPLTRYDFPLRMHVWSHDAAVWARYMQDMVSPALAEEYRREVFASQININSKDDMLNFTKKFLNAHGQQVPFVLDPSGRFLREVDADEALGEKANLNHTPSIFVVTQNRGWIEILDPMQLYSAIDEAIAATKNDPSATTHK